ncbi:MAG TPA: hypothetical protein IAA52_02670 [Candidatus Pullichristensenella stercorigallinarum]|uniref:Uncharacterized protein n=1 Tax=Candidatus Pullichristensenella stercorigallinarum TaxID=2840909 RepID=A0A9D0ZK19_9FIRM|nr:hypothetical protein [Candidatus Pullichristensenella stercorigallinarum]
MRIENNILTGAPGRFSHIVPHIPNATRTKWMQASSTAFQTNVFIIQKRFSKTAQTNRRYNTTAVRKGAIDMEKKQGFFARAFADMKESAQMQHAVDKAEFEAIKLESQAFRAEAKAQRNALAKERIAAQNARIGDAHRRMAEAQERIAAAKAAPEA